MLARVSRQGSYVAQRILCQPALVGAQVFLEAKEPCQGRQRSFASGSEGTEGGSSSWMPTWLRNRLPGALGGDREATTLENMDLDSYATALKRARQLGSLTGFVGGTNRLSSPLAKGNLRAYEDIIAAMNAEEKADLTSFGPAGRQRVAQQSGCSTAQVDDCIAKFEWMKLMSSRMAALKRAGKPLPTSMAEVEQSMGSWRGHKQQLATSPQAATSSGAATVPRNLVDSKGRQCPLAGRTVSRNTKCSLTRKTWKSCCGKALLVAQR